MTWSNPYIGLPWQEKGVSHEGVSCWGLPVLVYREVLGINLPTYAEAFACSAERREVEAVIGGATASASWHGVGTAESRDFDIAVFRIGGIDSHVGVVCGAGRMLHITAGQQSAVARLQDGRWASRLSGIYRHAALMDAACAA